MIFLFLNILSTPFTKVEESFNTQALHDFIFTRDLKDFDHLEFSGVVERSFTGALLLFILGFPLFTLLGFLRFKKIYYLIIGILLLFILARIILGILNYYSQEGFRSMEYVILENVGFHLNFWSSRFIPNSFALFFTNLAFFFQLKNDSKSGLICLGLYVFVAVVFRAEVAVLGGIVILQDLYYKKYRTRDGIITGAAVFFISLMWTVGLDSYLWKKDWLWPELQVFIFNTWKNGSRNYGTLPFYTYFFHFLPKIAPLSYPMALMASFGKDGQKQEYKRILRPVFLYVFIYSFLPHKEWRFVMYTVSPLQYVASRYMKSFKSMWILKVLAFGVFIFSLVAMGISSLNYPGGVALSKVPIKEGSVYIDTFTAMNGASRFGQVYPCRPWWFEQDCGFETICPISQDICRKEIKLKTLAIPTYDKNETQIEFKSYTYILTNEPTKYPDRKVYDVIYGYDGLGYVQMLINQAVKMDFKYLLDFSWYKILGPKVWILE